MAKPAVQVEHFLLTPAFPDKANKLASLCPACGEGVLGVVRHAHTLEIQPQDICLLCGQVVVYADVADMRRKDWANREHGA